MGWGEEIGCGGGGLRRGVERKAWEIRRKMMQHWGLGPGGG